MSKETDEKKKGERGLLQKLLPCCFGVLECPSCISSSAASTSAHKSHAKSKHKTKVKESEKGETGIKIIDKKGKKKHKHALSTPAILLLAAVLTFMQALAILYTVFYLPD